MATRRGAAGRWAMEVVADLDRWPGVMGHREDRGRERLSGGVAWADADLPSGGGDACARRRRRLGTRRRASDGWLMGDGIGRRWLVVGDGAAGSCGWKVGVLLSPSTDLEDRAVGRWRRGCRRQICRGRGW
ncbi:hypothetical protein ACLOJK_036338 [Asimina triloba]